MKEPCVSTIFNGRRIFQHRNGDKWDLFLHHKRIKDFWFETDCVAFIRQLRARWSGAISPELRKKLDASAVSRRAAKPPNIAAVMISCAPRDELRRQPCKSGEHANWGDAPLIQMDDGKEENPVQRQLHSTCLVLKSALVRNPDYILFLEDDLLFNRHLRHNLLHWTPIKGGLVTLSSLYNPNIREAACDIRHQVRVVRAHSVFGSQAFLLSKATVKYVLKNWGHGDAGQDLKIARLAGRLKKPIFYHAPSLVQHVGLRSVWGGRFHQAKDFDPDWRA